MGHAFNGSFQFDSEDQLEEYLSKMTTENAIQLLNLAFTMANKCGVFETIDSHIIYLCLKKIKEK